MLGIRLIGRIFNRFSRPQAIVRGFGQSSYTARIEIRAIPGLPVQMSGDPNLLIIDDSRAICRIVEKLLRQCGLRNIEWVQSGQQALERLAAAKFDAVLCDWQMHPMDGLELLRNMRRRAAFRDTPVILMSAKRDPHWIAEAMRLGAACMIAKPFNIDTLKEKLDQLGLLARSEHVASANVKSAPQTHDAANSDSYFILDA